MATVVHVPQDPRPEAIGLGVAKFLNRMRETRLDKLQQDLMKRISEAPDEATAAALLADPRYQDVVNNNERFARIDAHLTNAQPGQESLLGYNEDGEQVIFSVRKGSPINQDTYASRGLHPSPEVPFYATDPTDPESLPVLIGQFRSRGEAAREASDRFGLSESNIFNAAEAEMEMRRATQFSQNRRADAELGLSQDRLDLAKSQPQSAIGQVMDDWRSGKFGPPDGPSAITLRDRMLERIVTIVGRTGPDVTDETKQSLLEEGAAIQNFTRRSLELVQQVRDDPRVLSKVGALDRFAQSASAELQAAAQFAGIGKLDLDEYDFGGFAAQSITFKNMLVDLAINYAASKGIKGRDLTDKDFQRFLGIIGADLNNPTAFVRNMTTLLGNIQEDFRTKWRLLQEAPSGGTIGSYEDTYGAFPTVPGASGTSTLGTWLENIQKNYNIQIDLPE